MVAAVLAVLAVLVVLEGAPVVAPEALVALVDLEHLVQACSSPSR